MAKSRKALDELLLAFEKHYAVASNEDSTDDEILEVEDELLNAFFVYDDTLFLEYGVEIPIDLLAELFNETNEEDFEYSDEEFNSVTQEYYDDEEDEYELDEDI